MDPTWGPIGKEVFERTYSRRLPGGSSETWPDTVRRVVSGNLALVAPEFIEPGEEESLTALLTSFDAIPAGRHLWASGADTKLGLFNCHRAGWSSVLSDHFCFGFDQLMIGGGVGSNYSQNYLDLSPRVDTVVALALSLDAEHPDFEESLPNLSPREGSVPVVVADSREGWTAALADVIDAHVWRRSFVSMDLSAVRPRGSDIAGFGGTASGPGPLAVMLQAVNEILNGSVGRKILPLEAMEIDHAVASCVVAGNVRRSARMSILHWADPSIFDFIECKSDPSKHWSTNISVEVDDAFFDALGVADVHARAVLEAVAVGIHSNGEPGFYNSSLASVGERAGADVRSTNPCGEIGLEEWEQCCLGHVNLAAFSESHSKALAAFRYMSRYLVRATFGSSSDVRQERVKGRNRRIGVGFFGFHDWAALQGVRFDDIPGSPELRRRLVEYREIVEESAHLYADELGIARPIKTTCVAPTGSIAKLPGVSEGIQPPYSRFFVRRIRYADNDPKLLELPGEQEPCLYSPATTVVSFPCREAVLDRVSDSLVMQSNEVSLEAYLEVQALVQKLYADNAISITANFHRDAATVEDLASLLQKYLPVIKGFTAMPEDGRPQSPYERISSADYYAAGSRGVGQAIDDCAAGACPIR